MESMNDQLVAGSFCKAWRKKRSGENEPSCMWADQHTICSPSVMVTPVTKKPITLNIMKKQYSARYKFVVMFILHTFLRSNVHLLSK